MTDEHLSDDALSALLDEEENPGVAAVSHDHLESCVMCSSRFAALKDAAQWIGQPVTPVDELAVERAVSRALDVAREELDKHHRSLVQQLARRPAAIATVAAVAATIGIIAPRILSDDTADQQASSRSSASYSTTADDVVEGEFLRLNATSDLREPLRNALDPSRVNDEGGASAVGGEAEVTNESAEEPVPSSPGLNNASESMKAPRRYSANLGDTQKRCEPFARAHEERLGKLRFRAQAVFDDAEAVVMAFDIAPTSSSDANKNPTSQFNLRAYVMSASDCRVLSVQSFAL